MIALFRRVHLPYWRRAPVDFLLPALGIAVGVAAIVAIDLGSASTVSSFRSTIERIEGRTTHQVTGHAAPLDPALAYSLAEIEGVEASAPVVEEFALLAPEERPDPDQPVERGEPLRLIGIDPFAESGIRTLGLDEASEIEGQEDFFFPFLGQPGAILVSRPFLERNAIAVGDSLGLIVGARPVTAWVLGALPERVGDIPVPDNLALGDFATAQELSGRDDATRIDLILADDAALERVRAALPDGIGVQSPGGRSERLGEMVRALRSNLKALSYLALFVSLFLIYNAMLLGVLRRRASIGLSRCLGATRGEVLGAWVLEGLGLGILGTLIGLPLGILGGGVALEGFRATASGLYGHVEAGVLQVGLGTVGKATVVGLLSALVAAAFPAAEAARVTPAHTAIRGEVEARARRLRIVVLLLTIPLLGAAVVLVRWPGTSVVPGYLAVVCLALALSLVTPAAAHFALGVLTPILRRIGLLPAIAARNIRASMSRTGVALAALAVALSMSVAMGTMVGAFRGQMVGWIEETVVADVYISPATAVVSRTDARLSEELVGALARRPGVRATDTLRGLELEADGILTFCAGLELGVYRMRTLPEVLDGPSPEEFLDRIEHGQAGITESLARKTGKGEGDEVELRYGDGVHRVRVAGVYRDYSSDRGAVFLDRRTFEGMFGRRPPNGVALYLDEGVDVDAYVEELQLELSSQWSLLIRSNRTLRNEALDVFDKTFAVSRALEAIGIAVAAIGILGALLAMLLERRREIATLRALALTKAQVGRLLLMESMLIAVLAWVLALGLGSALAWILLRVINVRAFGWSLPWALPVESWMINLGFSLLAAGLATVYPILRSRRLSIAAGLREE
jgi:putative ABC transport system permease protein